MTSCREPRHYRDVAEERFATVLNSNYIQGTEHDGPLPFPNGWRVLSPMEPCESCGYPVVAMARGGDSPIPPGVFEVNRIRVDTVCTGSGGMAVRLSATPHECAHRMIIEALGEQEGRAVVRDIAERECRRLGLVTS